MRKYLIGILIGAALTISTNVFASDVISLIGQKIQGEFPVKINGEPLEKPAIVINGTSYLPNRAIADALGMDIKFDADLGIELSNKEVSQIMSESNSDEVTYTASYIDGMISILNTRIWGDEARLETEKETTKIEEINTRLKKNQDELAIWEARKAALTQ